MSDATLKQQMNDEANRLDGLGEYCAIRQVQRIASANRATDPKVRLALLSRSKSWLRAARAFAARADALRQHAALL